MTATLNSNNISSLIAAAASENTTKLLQNIKNEEKQKGTSSSHDDLETIQHPKIKKFLKTYHSSAQKSILGPNSINIDAYSAAAALKFVDTHQQHQQLLQQYQLQQQQQQHNRKFTETSNFDSDDWSAPPPNSLIKGCISLASADNNGESTERCETLLHGERITCFIVGGEKRLCLPQMLNYVLKDFSVHEINTVCEKLHIYCSRCTQEQLSALKLNNILPPSAPSCGLITLSDAERLCHKLMSTYIAKHKKAVMLNDDQENRVQLKVYHCCFGRAYGIVHPHLYSNQNAQCVECETCHLLFSPQNFVVHAHRNDESRICHWGFDSANWRFYIKLVDSCRDENKYKQEFEIFKNKFSHKRKSMNDDATTGYTNSSNTFKSSNSTSVSDLHTSNGGSLFKKILKTNTDAIEVVDHHHHNKSGLDVHHQAHHLMNNEHKLLNDLLSKPITNNTNTTTPVNSAIAMYPVAAVTAAAQLLNPKLISSIYPPATAATSNDIHKKISKYIDDYPVKTTTSTDDAVSKFDSNTAIEVLLDNLQNEIDGHMKSTESRERLANYLMRIKAAYNENLIKLVKSRLEIQESKQNIELENEILKSRIKYLELDNQFLRNQLNKSSTSNNNSSTSTSYLKFYQHDDTASSVVNDTTTTTATSNESSSSSSSSSKTNDELSIDQANSPQQQAAAIALIALHSPPSLTSTPKKSHQMNNKNSSGGAKSVSPNSATPYNINNQISFIKCEQIQATP